jgi:hypothetical protein
MLSRVKGPGNLVAQGFKMFEIGAGSVQMKFGSEKNNKTPKSGGREFEAWTRNFEGLSLLFAVCKKPRTCLRLPSGDEADTMKCYEVTKRTRRSDMGILSTAK